MHFYSQEHISGFNRQDPVGRPSILGFKFPFISLIVQEMFSLFLSLSSIIKLFIEMFFFFTGQHSMLRKYCSVHGYIKGCDYQ